MQKIAITNQKGGCGKTTLAYNLGYYLAREKKNAVLLIDLDPQGDLTRTAKAEEVEGGAFELFSDEEATIKPHVIAEGLHILPASKKLSMLPKFLTETGADYRLREALEEVEQLQSYDYVIIDTPPALSIITINALTAADFLIIPAEASSYSINATQELLATMERVKKYNNPTLQVAGVALMRHSNRSIVGRQAEALAEEIAKAAGTKLFKNSIRDAVAVKESQFMQTSIFEYAPGEKVTDDFKQLSAEIEKAIKPKKR
jgi:chromosome partitioning protein